MIWVYGGSEGSIYYILREFSRHLVVTASCFHFRFWKICRCMWINS